MGIVGLKQRAIASRVSASILWLQLVHELMLA
jgi:hypothetical protein